MVYWAEDSNGDGVVDSGDEVYAMHADGSGLTTLSEAKAGFSGFHQPEKIQCVGWAEPQRA